MSTSTTFAKETELNQSWFIVSAKGERVGRLATRIATVLMGKHKAGWTPNVDTGDFVIVTDAGAVTLAGRKETQKVYRFHTGYMGGLKEVPFARLRAEHPERVIELAVRRMLPKTTLARNQMRKLKIYAGAQHPHAAQQPKPLPKVKAI